jgi:hypothetical protein
MTRRYYGKGPPRRPAAIGTVDEAVAPEPKSYRCERACESLRSSSSARSRKIAIASSLVIPAGDLGVHRFGLRRRHIPLMHQTRDDVSGIAHLLRQGSGVFGSSCMETMVLRPPKVRQPNYLAQTAQEAPQAEISPAHEPNPSWIRDLRPALFSGG